MFQLNLFFIPRDAVSLPPSDDRYVGGDQEREERGEDEREERENGQLLDLSDGGKERERAKESYEE